MIRHKFTGLYFKPGYGGELVKEKGKIYRTNNDMLAQYKGCEISTSCWDKKGDILRKMNEAGIEPHKYTRHYYSCWRWDLPDGEYALSDDNHGVPNTTRFSFHGNANHYDRVHVKLVIEIGEPGA